jgi:cytoskeletal protein RodZ
VAIFCYKQIESLLPLPQLFRTRRAELGFSFEQLPFRNHVSPIFLEALEKGSFEKLPQSKTYRLAYVRAYAEALGLPPERCINQFISEGGLDNITFKHPHQHIKLLPFKSWSILIRNIIIGLAILSFLSYLVWQIKTIITPPELLIFSPTDSFITKETYVMVEGETEPAAHLTINGQEVNINNQGRFSLKFDLISGLNTITIATNKKHGKTTTKTLNVIMRPENFLLITPPTSSTVP